MLVLLLDISQKQKNMLPFLNPAPLIFIFGTLFGVLVHDMHIDRAARVAIAPPSSMTSASTSSILESIISRTEHTHVERTSVNNTYSSSLPKVQPPRDDVRKYVQNKRQFESGGDDHTYMVPST